MSDYWQYIKHFKPSEFDSPGSKGSGKRMNEELIRHLDAFRIKFKSPIIINSGYRTAAHNASIGGVSDSAHLTGEAADIRCTDSAMRYELINYMLRLGIMRIGIANSFIHIDVKSNAPLGVIWTYK